MIPNYHPSGVLRQKQKLEPKFVETFEFVRTLLKETNDSMSVNDNYLHVNTIEELHAISKDLYDKGYWVTDAQKWKEFVNDKVVNEHLFIIFKNDESGDYKYIDVSNIRIVYYWTDDTPYPFIPFSKLNKAIGPTVRELLLDRYKGLKQMNKGKFKYNYDFDTMDFMLYQAKLNNDRIGQFNICDFDIEVIAKEFYKPENPKGEIGLISMFMNHTGQFIQLINKSALNEFDLEKIREEFEKHIINDKLMVDVKDISFVIVDNEIELLKTFAKLLHENKVDVIDAWNIYYDINYIYNRMKYIGLDTSILSPIGKPMYMSSKLGYAMIPGIIVIDAMELYKSYRNPKLSRWTLDYVSKVDLGVGKVEYDGSIFEFMQNDVNRFIAYSMIDTILLYNLNKKLGQIQLQLMVKNLSWCSYVNSLSTIAQIDGLIFQYTYKKGLGVRQRPYNVSKEGQFAGAFVREPKTGYIPWVIDIDASSMYPSIIITLNISPETFVGYIENSNIGFMEKMLLTDELDDMEITLNTTPNLNAFGTSNTIKMTVGKLKQIIREKDLIISYNGTLFTKSIVGIIPEIERTLIKLRKEYKEKAKQALAEKNHTLFVKYNVIQLALKVLANAIYGASGNVGYRFFDIRISTTITLTAQIENKLVSGALDAIISDFFDGKIESLDNVNIRDYVTIDVLRRAENKQQYVFYSDTDSSFIDIFELLALEVQYLLNHEDVLKETLEELESCK